MRRLILDGQRFGRLRVQREETQRKFRKVVWACICDCGNALSVLGSELVSGHTKSCGCLRLRHGFAKKRPPEYYSWCGMMTRCFNSKSDGYGRYGGRGITVCDRWRGFDGFSTFLKDMGQKPSSDHSLDRCEVNGNYEPSNCRWATSEEQIANRRKFGALSTFTNAELLKEVQRRQLSIK